MHDDEMEVEKPVASSTDIRKLVGIGVGVVAIVLAALFGTGAISSNASTAGDQGGPGGRQFPGGGGGQFPGGGQLPGGGGFRGGGGFPGRGQFQAPGQQQVVPSAPPTTTPPTLSLS